MGMLLAPHFREVGLLGGDLGRWPMDATHPHPQREQIMNNAMLKLG